LNDFWTQERRHSLYVISTWDPQAKDRRKEQTIWQERNDKEDRCFGRGILSTKKKAGKLCTVERGRQNKNKQVYASRTVVSADGWILFLLEDTHHTCVAASWLKPVPFKSMSRDNLA
jgi:hypothetical protein